MTDRWYYARETTICGPVSSEELERLIQTGSIGPIDMVWPDGADSATAVPAKAVPQLLKPPVTDATAAIAAPPALPEWLPALAGALARAESPNLLGSPSAAAWITDVRRAESARPRTETSGAVTGHGIGQGPGWTVEEMAMELVGHCDELHKRHAGLGWPDVRNALLIALRYVEERAAEDESGATPQW
jgi:hypothetical protein